MKKLITSILFIMISMIIIAQPKAKNHGIEYLSNGSIKIGNDILSPEFEKNKISELIIISKKIDVIEKYCIDNKVSLGSKEIGKIDDYVFHLKVDVTESSNFITIFIRKNNERGQLMFLHMNFPYYENITFTELLTIKRDTYYKELAIYNTEQLKINSELDVILSNF